MLPLFGDVLLNIGCSVQDLLLNAFDTLFLFVGQIQSSIQGVGAALVNFNQLLLIKNFLLRNEARANGEILLGIFIVCLKVFSLVESCVIEVPVPSNEMDAKPGGMSCQHGSVEVSQQIVVASQALSLQGRSLFQ